MTPVLQTHRGGPEAAIVGNCMQAAVASILDLPLDAVPHFVQEAPGGSMDLLRSWLAERGMTVAEVPTDTPGVLLVFGPTRSGIHHWVVYRDGRLAHDPAAGEGLFYAERFYAIRDESTPPTKHAEEKE